MIDAKYTQPQYWLGLSEVGALETGLAEFAEAMLSLSVTAIESSITRDELYVAWEEVETSGSMNFLRVKDEPEPILVPEVEETPEPTEEEPIELPETT